MPPSIATPLSSLTARDLYGVRALTPTGVVPFGYTGHAEDPTGLTWGRARCYAPRTGGWTGEDPVFTEPRYAYVGGSPSYGGGSDGFCNRSANGGLFCVSSHGSSRGYGLLSCSSLGDLLGWHWPNGRPERSRRNGIGSRLCCFSAGSAETDGVCAPNSCLRPQETPSWLVRTHGI